MNASYAKVAAATAKAVLVQHGMHGALGALETLAQEPEALIWAKRARTDILSPEKKRALAWRIAAYGQDEEGEPNQETRDLVFAAWVRTETERLRSIERLAYAWWDVDAEDRKPTEEGTPFASRLKPMAPPTIAERIELGLKMPKPKKE